MYFIIYETINLVNGKRYRGCHQTNNIEDGYFGSGKVLQQAIKKYGKHSFSRTILEYCSDRKSMLEREKFWVNSEFLNREDTYNLKLGGDGFTSDDVSGNKNSFFGKKHTEENKKAQSDRMKLRVGNKNHFFGKRHAQSTIERIKQSCKSSALYGDDNPAKREEVRARIKKGLSGKPKSISHRRKLSQSKTRTYNLISPSGDIFEMYKHEIKEYCAKLQLHYLVMLKFLNKGTVDISVKNMRKGKHYHLLDNTIGWELKYKSTAIK